MRGTENVNLATVGYYRITPAHAGNRLSACNSSDFTRDHPRTCGEQNGYIAQEVPEEGSPPHMRGTDERTRQLWVDGRITPAHAGNSENE